MIDGPSDNNLEERLREFNNSGKRMKESEVKQMYCLLTNKYSIYDNNRLKEHMNSEIRGESLPHEVCSSLIRYGMRRELIKNDDPQKVLDKFNICLNNLYYSWYL